MDIRTKIEKVAKRLASINGRGLRHLKDAATTAAALIATTVFVAAADLPSKSAPPVFAPPPPPAFTWTGFYVGAHVGVGTDHFAFPFVVSSNGDAFQARDGITATGPIGGVQAGFNYQLPYNIVVGVELDNSWSGIRGQSTTTGPLIATGYGTATFGSKFLDFATARGRIGYAFDRLLVYFTGGLTAGVINTYYYTATQAPFFASGSSTVTRSGVLPHVGVVGIGAEYAITNNWTVKAEYLYDFVNAHNANYVWPNGAVNFGTRTMYHIGRVGLNYKFDWLSPQPAPVVAKY